MTAPVVYLVHLDQKLGSSHPNGSAGHYLGTTINLAQRLTTHREGKGAKILAAAVERGIGFDVVRTWPGGRAEERRLKRQRNAPRLCPRCSGT
jgi:predicted GIY-YIG superfamily endonuclease